MKPLLALILAVTATAQTPAPNPEPHIVITSNGQEPVNSSFTPLCPPNGCNYGTIPTSDIQVLSMTDEHGCNIASQWDAEKKVCAIRVTFSPDMTPPITCSPVAKDSEGHQTMICWYKPAAQTGEKL